jgi:hypothetical protein
MFEQLKVGVEVHYMQANGTHSKAVVLRVGENGVVDLNISRDDDPSITCVRKTVVHRGEPQAYSWHFITEQCSAGEQLNANHSQ